MSATRRIVTAHLFTIGSFEGFALFSNAIYESEPTSDTLWPQHTKRRTTIHGPCARRRRYAIDVPLCAAAVAPKIPALCAPPENMQSSDPYTAMIDRQRLASLRVAEDREFERRTMRSRTPEAHSSCTLLCIDEAHPFQFAFGLYGMSDAVAGWFTRHVDVDGRLAHTDADIAAYHSAAAAFLDRIIEK
jgi:hypothetical protein